MLLFAVLAVLSLLGAFGIARGQAGSWTARVLLILAVVCTLLAILLWIVELQRL